MPFLQDWVHRLEVGAGIRYLRNGLACLALVMLTFGYDWLSYRNMATQEAMDAAQVGRNLAEGKGFTTLFVRPLSMHLVKKRNEARLGGATANSRADYSQINGMHPDLANPPVYPVVLAGLMKVLPFNYTASATQSFWSKDGRFWRYQPDFLISLFNQIIFFTVIGLTFLLARQLFDPGIAWLSGLLLLGCELLWRFSVSGLSTMLLMAVFVGLAWCLVLIEREAREPKRGLAALVLLAAGAGLLAGVGALTRYSFGWVMVPVLLFLVLFSGPRKGALCLTAAVAFVIVLTPWVYRNLAISGTPFGTATYAIIEGTDLFPGHSLERSLNPNWIGNYLTALGHKLLINSRDIMQNDVPALGGSWVTPFFLAGLMVGFRSPAIRRLRYFIVMCLGTLVVVQALGRTQLSEDAREINSENLLVLLVPFVLVYGVSLFYVLLDQVNLPIRELRYAVIGLFTGLVCLPMVCSFLPPRTRPVVYPPYYPPEIQQTANWMKESELMMSDIPWAMAWYGHRQCLWLTLNAQSDFFAVNDYQKPVQALYITRQTMDRCLLSEWLLADEASWENLILNATVQKGVRSNFPLAHAIKLRDDLFLTDWLRWNRPPPPSK
jgi:Dolichyl-phosphate-mannose-protein mannosyltransferase